ncbi:cytochrome P450 [Trametes versicolor FP-101664 SS1]|uniref:cytochrome P450 n=1 Tax=Trametes versicolor (strain FP-101664) TaxID=717944 RepID=UPI0004622491|nr:cytochrome P450 [Trametes versicolor FP-101664 SS1]EIW64803.1 cytochrome P450 [Trametes versicolor FP-101664 SS1]
MEDPSIIYACVAVAAVAFIVRWYTDPLRAIPTVGGSDLPLLSYGGAFRWVHHGKEMLQEGYDKYHGTTFKVAMLDRWLVVASGPKLVEEVRKRPDEELDNIDGLGQFVQTKYTLGEDVHNDPFHADIIRDKLARGLPAVLPDVIDELTVATREHIPTEGDAWLSVNVSEKTRDIVARASSRVFVGLPLCRNKGYLDLAVDFTISVMKDRAMINIFPEVLKPIIGRLVSKSATSVRQVAVYLAPLIKERQRLMAEHGDDWSEKPNDMLQWIMEAAATRDPSVKAIVERMLVVNFAAIHTSSNSVSHALYHLAERPELLKPLREEIESLINEEGWTKNSMAKMWKLDSFLRESQRHNGVNIISLMRVAHKDITLSDGTYIPKGTLLSVPVYSMHHDESLYEDAARFDAFRFSRMREQEGEAAKHQYVNTSIDYVSFGHGKHACPGRFFAANELKAMLAHIVLNYDVKLPGDGKRPENMYWGEGVLAAPAGEVLFRKRQV